MALVNNANFRLSLKIKNNVKIRSVNLTKELMKKVSVRLVSTLSFQRTKDHVSQPSVLLIIIT